MIKNPSNGYEEIAQDFIAYRSKSTTGLVAVRKWTDNMTGLESRSLGAETYKDILHAAGLSLTGNYVDEGDNYYYYAIKP